MKIALGRARVILIVMSAVCFANMAEARRFDFKDESLATYFRGTYSPSLVGDSAYGGSSGSGMTFDKKVSANHGGEIGVLISGSRVNLKLAAELLLPRELSDIKGTDAGEVEQFSLASQLLAFVPSANLEFITYQTPTSRMVFGAGLGMGFVTLDNSYTMTPAGTASLGLGDFTESASGSSHMLQGYLGYEVLFTDIATVMFEVGYRHLKINELKSTKAVTTPTGAQTEGSVLTNMDGGNRTVNLSGPFAGLSFRFYIGL